MIEEVPRKEVSNLLGIFIEIQAKFDARRFIAIAENLEVFYFELGFNRYIQKLKEFFPNINTNFLALTDLNAQSLIEEVGSDPYFFMATVTTTLNKRLDIATPGPLSRDDPPLSSKMDKGTSPSFAKPLRAQKSRRRKR